MDPKQNKQGRANQDATISRRFSLILVATLSRSTVADNATLVMS